MEFEKFPASVGFLAVCRKLPLTVSSFVGVDVPMPTYPRDASTKNPDVPSVRLPMEKMFPVLYIVIPLG